MKRTSGSLLLVIGYWLLVCSAALAVPQYLSYQGVLRDNFGNLITGTKSIVFSIYDDATAGTQQFTMTSAEVSVNGGLYNVMLGPLGYAELGSGRRWLEVAVGGETLSPRIELAAVAYAVTAANAETVNNISASATATANTILPLDANKQLKGMSVSAEAGTGNYALYSSGKIGAKYVSGNGGASAPVSCVVGTGTLASTGSSVTVYNDLVTTSSLVFLTPKFTATNASYKWMKIDSVSSGSFVVETYDGASPIANQEFYYLVIN